MGVTGAQAAATNGLALEQLPMILGDAMPELPRDPVGRHRLVRALQQRFGDNFRALPGVSSLVEQFDREIENEARIRRIAAVKMRSSYGKPG